MKQSIESDVQFSIADMFHQSCILQSILDRVRVVHNRYLEELKFDFQIFNFENN